MRFRFVGSKNQKCTKGNKKKYNGDDTFIASDSLIITTGLIVKYFVAGASVTM